MDHKFKLGDFVRMEQTPNRSVEKTFEIVRLLPRGEDGELRYHVRSSKETHARSVGESQLQRTSHS